MFMSSGKVFGRTKNPSNIIPAPFSAVALLLHFNEGSGTSTVDSSSSPAAATFGGAAAISSATFIAGASSLQLTTAAADGVKFASNVRFNCGQSAYTIECWVRPLSPSGGSQQCIWTFNGAVAQNPYLMIIGATMYLRGGNVSPDLVTAFAHGMAADTWHHVAVVKSGANIAVYLDGVLKGSSASSGSSITSENKTFSVGGGGTVATMSGFVDEVRLTAGYAIYTGPFTTPTPPFPDS